MACWVRGGAPRVPGLHEVGMPGSDRVGGKRASQGTVQVLQLPVSGWCATFQEPNIASYTETPGQKCNINFDAAELNFALCLIGGEFFNCSDPTALANNDERINEVWNFVNEFQHNFHAMYTPGSWLLIAEGMITCNGRLLWKQ